MGLVDCILGGREDMLTFERRRRRSTTTQYKCHVTDIAISMAIERGRTGQSQNQTTTMATTGLIDVSTKYIAPAEAALPALAVHITRLVDSYMIWVGATEETAETVGDAPRTGSLCGDWACAMPSTPGSAVSAAPRTCRNY